MASLHAAPSRRTPDACQLPGEILALLIAAERTQADVGSGRDPATYALHMAEKLWDQGYVVIRASTHLLGRLTGLVLALAVGFAVGLYADPETLNSPGFVGGRMAFGAFLGGLLTMTVMTRMGRKTRMAAETSRSE